MLHTEDSRRYDLMLQGVKDGRLPSPTYGIPTEVFVHFVDGVPVEAHATNKLAAEKARFRSLKDGKPTRNYDCPVRVDVVNGEIVETPMYVEPFIPIFGWVRSGRSFLRDSGNTPAFNAVVEEFNALQPPSAAFAAIQLMSTVGL